MRPILLGLIAFTVVLPLASSATAGTLSLSARSHHHYRHHQYRHSGNSRGALRMFGMVAGTIAGIAAADAARDDWRRGYGYYGYGYPPPRPYPYGPYYPY
jgi:hypothetical protein